jgi:superfamily II DNA or RNA helicase
VAKTRELRLGKGHGHQERAYQWARRVLWERWRSEGAVGGILLADGVGLGKTYEALGTVATFLSQSLHNRERARAQPFHVLILVPPRLVGKWSDELTDPARFGRYLQGWDRGATTAAVAETFERIAVFRYQGQLLEQPGMRHRGQHVLTPGAYVVNWNLLGKHGRKFTQLHKTRWDAIIVDEAHHLGGALVSRSPHSIIAHRKTLTLLLTATPFQLNPSEMQDLFAGLFGGYGESSSWERAFAGAKELYAQDGFANYRKYLKALFSGWSDETYSNARALRRNVEDLLRPYVVRNQRQKNRLYHFARADGTAVAIPGDVFALDDRAISRELIKPECLIELGPEAKVAYLRVRDDLARRAAAGERPFVAGVLRQFLSTWGQYRRSMGKRSIDQLPSDRRHPKVEAAAKLTARLVREELRRLTQQGWVGKVLLFTTYVGAEHANRYPGADDAHGTAATLKRVLERSIEGLIEKPRKGLTVRIRERLVSVLEKALPEGEDRTRLRRALTRFASSRMAGIQLASADRLDAEARHLSAELASIQGLKKRRDDLAEQGRIARAAEKERLQDDEWRVEQRYNARMDALRQRYATRDLVARFDGSVAQDLRDLHMRGFNSPYAPLVLIVSSVGQEGIDLQRYCKHVIHYDLEWNPARMEQREGRVDRLGRAGDESINVYFMLCRGTYDERVFHVMVNRARWHQVLMADKDKLERDPGEDREEGLDPAHARRLRLDLSPP